MKKLILLTLIISAFASCSKEEPEIKPTLAGTLWSSYFFKTTFGGEDVYKMLRFISEDKVEYYSATEKSRLIGTKDTLRYEYNQPVLSVDFIGENMNGKTYTGEVFENYLILGQSTYNKE